MGVGRTARRTASACARAPRARASTRAPGPPVSRPAECTRGQAETTTRASGCKASGMAWAWRPRAAGCTAASGHRASRDATACASRPRQGPSTRAPGPRGCRMATASRPTLTEVGDSTRRLPTPTTVTVCRLLSVQVGYQDALSNRLE